MRIDGNGRVIIGGSSITNLPGSYKLYVTGGVLTEQVTVAIYGSTGWADYVFDRDYKLMSLDSLENFIQNNKHLPNVPSTEEVIKNGNNLGNTDKILLEKIEELTLYIIELKKEQDRLVMKVNSLTNSEKQ